MIRRRSHAEHGFVLIEAVVALAIFVAVLSLFYQGWRTAAEQTQRVDRAAAALTIARARIAAAGVDPALTPGTTEGSEGPFRWTLAIEERAREPSASERGTLLRAYLVRIEVGWDEGASAGGSVRLATVKLAERP